METIHVSHFSCSTFGCIIHIIDFNKKHRTEKYIEFKNIFKKLGINDKEIDIYIDILNNKIVIMFLSSFDMVAFIERLHRNYNIEIFKGV